MSEARGEIEALRSAGYGYADTARILNARRVPTPSGRGEWWPSTVRRHVDPAPWAKYVRTYRQARRRAR